MAWSLIHGGPGGNFLSNTLYNAIAYNGTCKIDKDIRDEISTVCFNNIFNGNLNNELITN